MRFYKTLCSLLLFFSVLAHGQTGLPKTESVSPRIVTLAPVISEWVAEILGRKATTERLVGVSEYSNYPEYVSTITKIGPYPQIDVEAVANLKPDLVIASSEYNLPEQIEKLKRLNLRVEVLPAEKFSNMEGWIAKVGDILGVERNAETVSRAWHNQVQKIKGAHEPHKPKRKMMLQVQENPLVTVGGTSFLTDAFAIAGYSNVFTDLDQAYPKVSKEAVLKAKPEVIFILDLTGNAPDFKLATEHWANLFKGEVRVLPGDDFARCSFRLLKALEKLK